MEQGRLASCHMFQQMTSESHSVLFPYDIYTIPEMSMVGHTSRPSRSKACRTRLASPATAKSPAAN